MKEEIGVMVMKDGKAWGKTYADGQSTSYGWMAPEQAPIHNSKYCTKTTDVTYKDIYYTEYLKTGKLVKVKRTIKVEVLDDSKD